MLDPYGTAGYLYDEDLDDDLDVCEDCHQAPCDCDARYDRWKDEDQ